MSPTRNLALAIGIAAAAAAPAPVAWHAGAEAEVSQNVTRHPDGSWTLAPGPNVEGVVFLRQLYPSERRWPQDVLDAFAATPWLDAASIRIRWAQLEPEDERFDWEPFDHLLETVRRHNIRHPENPRTLHIRPMAGEHVPAWFEHAGVRMYDTADPVRRAGTRTFRPIRIPVPYDNPEFLRQLRQLYAAMRARYGPDPLVTVFHGTWSAGPWDEIFHPQDDAPLPPAYSADRFVRGMIDQLDVLIDEFYLHTEIAELPYSGKYPSKARIDITGPLTGRIVERLGKRSPYLYIQSNGWGITNTGTPTVSWGHERDINDARAQVNLAFQAIGTNAGGGWIPQGDWIETVSLAKHYDPAYVEIYFADLLPPDTEHRIVEAFTHDGSPTGRAPGFLGFRPWLKERARVLYVRDGTVRLSFDAPVGQAKLDRIDLITETPAGTRVAARVRGRGASDGAWSDWHAVNDVRAVPLSVRVELEVVLHTDDGAVTPRLTRIEPVWQKNRRSNP